MLNTRSPDEPYLVERNPDYFEYQLRRTKPSPSTWPEGYRTAIRQAVELGHLAPCSGPEFRRLPS